MAGRAVRAAPGYANPPPPFRTVPPCMQGGLSTVLADLVWGIAEDGIDNTPNVQGDPAAEPVDNILTYQINAQRDQPDPKPLDFSDKNTQVMIRAIVEDLFVDVDGSVPAQGREGLVRFIARNPMNALREYCNPGSTSDAVDEDRPPPNLPSIVAQACSDPDPNTRLPTGKNFQIVAFTFLATTEEGVRRCLRCARCLHAAFTLCSSTRALPSVVPSRPHAVWAWGCGALACVSGPPVQWEGLCPPLGARLAGSPLM